MRVHSTRVFLVVTFLLCSKWVRLLLTLVKKKNNESGEVICINEGNGERVEGNAGAVESTVTDCMGTSRMF